MKLNKQELCNKSKQEILQLLNKNGSTFVTKLDNSKLLVQYLYLNDSDITALELLPSKHFQEISKDVWYFEQELPLVKNICYWLYKNCQALQDEEKDEKERVRLNILDKYSKNIVKFYKEDGTVSSSRAYILPVKIEKKNENLIHNKFKFYTDSLKEDREIVVVYPPNYNKDIVYPCLIISDATPWRCTMHLESKLYKLMEKNKIKHYILCFVIQKDRNIELPMNKNFSSFIANDLTSFLESKKITKNTKENFIFFGSSYGGLAGLYLEMFYHNKIGTIICQSASLWYDKNDEILNYFKNNKIHSKLYYSYGNCEINSIIEKGAQFKNIISKNKNCKFKIYSGGHEYFAWQDDLINALKWIDKTKVCRN